MIDAMPIAYGLDLAGYSGGYTGLARAERMGDGTIAVTVYQHRLFNRKYQGKDAISAQLAAEWQWVRNCCQQSSLLVDVPIAMQGLPAVQEVQFAWELTLRPVDFAFRALAPFASLIGTPAARFQYIMHFAQGELWHHVGTRIFETYPAASLKLMEQFVSYKSQRREPAHYHHGQWNNSAAGRLAASLNFLAEEGSTFTHDDLDAALCAITGVADEACLLQKDALKTQIARRIQQRMGLENCASFRCDPPAGFVLLQQLPPQQIMLKKERA
jgi:hypothetical protein